MIDLEGFAVTDMEEYEADSDNFLIVGPPGTGKTYSLTTHPNPDEILFLDCESGKRSLGGSRIKKVISLQYKMEDGEKVLIPENERWPRAVEISKRFAEAGPDCTFVVDTLGELQNYLAAWIMSNRTKQGPDNLALNEYGILDKHFKEFIRRCRDAEGTFICIAHAKRQEDYESGELKWYPMIVGGFRENIAGMFDFVFFANVKKGKGDPVFKWLTAGSDKYQTKDRDGRLDKVIDPNWKQVLNIVRAKKGESDGS